jgi:hypothetical protein
MIYTREDNEAILLYPNKNKVVNFIKKKLKPIIKRSQNYSAMMLISKLNPVIKV